MYHTYIYYSQKGNRYYIGFCADVAIRLERHNAGYVTAIRPYIPKLGAMQEEQRLKNKKSRKYLEFLIAGTW